MADEPDVYSYLATSKVSEVTVAQLEQSLENSFINKRNIESWKGPITVHRLLEVSRTYPWGLPIPELGAVLQTAPIDPSGSGVIQPDGSELWQVTGMMGTGAVADAVVDISWYDGSNNVVMVSQKTLTTAGVMIDINEKVSAPFVLSNSLYLKIDETAGNSPAIIKMAYHKVSV